MSSNPPPRRPPDDPPPPAPDALGDLEERLDRASKAAERLISEADQVGEPGAGEQRAERPPPAGWQNRPAEDQVAGGRELELLTQLIRSVRELLPAELERRLAEALRELLLALRALIDFYLERLGRREPPDEEARDIPIS